MNLLMAHSAHFREKCSVSLQVQTGVLFDSVTVCYCWYCSVDGYIIWNISPVLLEWRKHHFIYEDQFQQNI